MNLELNTDRFWATLGVIALCSLVIGAALVFFPELMSNIFDKMQTYINGINVPN
jgi:ABC-type Mn2+/Zn2+ transport system permease subunit